VGELQHWSKTLFNPAPGGGAGIVGIVWLAPIFGIYFAMKLASAGQGPVSVGKSIGFTVLGLVVLVGGVALMFKAGFGPSALEAAGVIVIAAAVAVPLAGWPSLTKALLVYGYLARIPVAIIMFFAIRGNWGTHYDGLPPNFPEMGFWLKYFQIGLLPQLVFWVAFTVIVGSLFGTVAIAIAGRGKVAAHASP
jgi:hypothetical protein